jgi:hypothetical protein
LFSGKPDYPQGVKRVILVRGDPLYLYQNKKTMKILQKCEVFFVLQAMLVSALNAPDMTPSGREKPIRKGKKQPSQ